MDETTFDKIRTLIERYNSKLAQIRSDQNLSDLGRRNAIVAEYRSTRDKRDALLGADETQADARRKALRQKLFGLGPLAGSADVISLRDAQDRVARVGSAQELADLMERASGVGDRTLLRAGFELAFNNSSGGAIGGAWGGIVDAYVEEFPGAADDLAEYQGLTGSRDRTLAFAEQMATSVPVPPELNDRRPLSDEKPMQPPRPDIVGVPLPMRGHFDEPWTPDRMPRGVARTQKSPPTSLPVNPATPPE